ILRQAVEELRGARQQEVSGGSGARKVADGVVELEEEGAAEAADVTETGLGAIALAAGNSGLPRGGDESGGQREDGQRRGGAGQPIAADERGGIPPGCRRTGADGTLVQPRGHVVSEGFDAAVAALGIFLQSAEHEGVEVAAQPARERAVYEARSGRRHLAERPESVDGAGLPLAVGGAAGQEA